MGNITIMQGDQYALTFTGTQDGEPLDTASIEEIEFLVGDLRKCWPETVTQDEDGNFLFPLTQRETMQMQRTQPVQIRVKYTNSAVPVVIGVKLGTVDVTKSDSKVVL